MAFFQFNPFLYRYDSLTYDSHSYVSLPYDSPIYDSLTDSPTYDSLTDSPTYDSLTYDSSMTLTVRYRDLRSLEYDFNPHEEPLLGTCPLRAHH